MKRKIWGAGSWLKRHWRTLALYSGGGIVGLLLAVQLAYPFDRLPLFMSIDGVSVSAQTQEEATRQLNELYRKKEIEIHSADSSRAFASPTTEEVGISVTTNEQVERVSYSWLLRVVPTSLFWAHATQAVDAPQYAVDDNVMQEYVKATLGEECRVEPRNPTVEFKDNKLVVEPAAEGGECDTEDVLKVLDQVRPRLGEETKAELEVEPLEPAIATEAVEQLVETIERQLQGGVAVAVQDEVVTLEAAAVRSWVIVLTDNDELTLALDAEASAEVMAEQFGTKLHRPAGVTRISTHDFAEVSRQDGAVGQDLDLRVTLDSIAAYLRAETEQPQATPRAVQPRVEYTRTYSPTNEGLSALIKNYADDKPGTYGVSLIELSGQRRRAGFNETREFTTASTYKVYVAYSALKRIDSGEYRWGDHIVGGNNLERCFELMIAHSDNPCSEQLIEMIGRRALTNEAREIGATQTTFLNPDGNKTTARDLSMVMASLESGQLPLSQDSRNRFLGALGRNIFRQGIPAGASGRVADKVGFLEGLLHDTAIVYSPAGTYVLTILTDNSSWANIAELTREIESLRAR